MGAAPDGDASGPNELQDLFYSSSELIAGAGVLGDRLSTVVRYAITDGGMFSGDQGLLLEDGRLRSAALGSCAQRWAEAGIDFIQVREKDLSEADLIALAQRIRAALPSGGGTRLLVNARSEVAVRVAVASGADGVHVPSGDLRGIGACLLDAGWIRAPKPVVSVSCHGLAEVREARALGADLVLFGPVFEKRVGGEVVRAGVGLGALREAARLAPGRVLALGGVTLENAGSCVGAGAVGVAGIRMFAGFQEAC